MTDNYATLRAVLDDAFAQAADGKGAERHANGLHFEQQPMRKIGEMVGVGFQAGQIMKKAQEAVGMVSRAEFDAADRELLGVITYAAGAILQVRAMKAAAATEKPADSLSGLRGYVEPVSAIDAASRPLPYGERGVWHVRHD